MLGTVNYEGLTSLRADEEVEAVEAAMKPTLIRPVRVAAAKLSSKTTWGIDFLHVPALWNQGLNGKDIRVAHLDTGPEPLISTSSENFYLLARYVFFSGLATLF